ncbi:hypothetical protein B0T16DRAFT_412390 [Cercophora newfieldiana]|uniref:BZIP domain-containing protein n=1 Tax=Cercophora newfieldiana TaxID=92897 RepID=A0AA39Y5A8_9PEZI|nr:hypothetical protein B0T16DRAFT_412390 [Cercophora newfieldiana]
MQNILNPPGPRLPQLESSSPPVPRPQAPDEASPPVKMERALYGGNSSPSRLPGHQNPAQPTHHAAPPPPTHSPAGPPPSGSPTTSYGPLAAARRILTPKSPRAASLSRAAMRSVEAHRLANLPPGVPRGGGGGPAHDASPLGGPPTIGGSPQLPGSIAGQGTGLPPSRPTSGLSRSLSQPMMGHGMPPTPSSQEQPPAGALTREQLGGRSLYSPGPPFGTPVPQSRAMMGEARWAAGVVGQLPPSGSAGRTLQLGDGQQHLLAITPTHGEEILIPVDYHQASKQADEKRQRNAGASARFRQRKKEKEKEQQQGLQKLESQNRELEKKIEELERRNQELEGERDFYRGERNRLRDIVSRTPSISEWADRGPPSPAPSRSAGSSYPTDNSPLPAPAPTPLPHPHLQGHPLYAHPQSLAHPHPHPSPASYGDPSMLERPARRRRTDSEPQLGTPSYRPTTPASLPPLPGGPAYAMPPQSPHLAASPGAARLPPIRFDNNPHPTSETPPPLQPGPPPPPAPQQIGQASAYPSFSKAPYETGWATGPRGPPEGGPR